MCAGASPLESDQVVICATVQICALFRGVRRIVGYKVEDAPPQVWKFITGSWFTPHEAQAIIEEFIECGYRITIKTTQEYVGVLEAVEWDEP